MAVQRLSGRTHRRSNCRWGRGAVKESLLAKVTFKQDLEDLLASGGQMGREDGCRQRKEQVWRGLMWESAGLLLGLTGGTGAR